MAEYAEQIAIYKRFASLGDLYDGTTESLYGFTFYYAYSYILGKESDNLFVQCVINSHGLGSESDQEIKIINQVLATIKKEAMNNPNKFIVFGCIAINDTAYTYTFEMSQEYYNDTAWPKIVEQAYAPRADISVDVQMALLDDARKDQSDITLKEETISL